jgi:hypothetical protein
VALPLGSRVRRYAVVSYSIPAFDTWPVWLASATGQTPSADSEALADSARSLAIQARDARAEHAVQGLRRAIDLLRKATSLYQSARDRVGQGGSLYTIGVMYATRGARTEASLKS